MQRNENIGRGGKVSIPTWSLFGMQYLRIKLISFLPTREVFIKWWCISMRSFYAGSKVWCLVCKRRCTLLGTHFYSCNVFCFATCRPFGQEWCGNASPKWVMWICSICLIHPLMATDCLTAMFNAFYSLCRWAWNPLHLACSWTSSTTSKQV